jgi:hypothetical protein
MGGAACITKAGSVRTSCWRLTGGVFGIRRFVPSLATEANWAQTGAGSAEAGFNLAGYRGQMFAGPGADQYFALYLTSDRLTTRLYENPTGLVRLEATGAFAVNTPFVGMINYPCRQGYAFPELVDGKPILYVGRSSATGETASASDPYLLWISKSGASGYGDYYFADHTGNLYALGAVGITDIWVDTESD